VTNEAPPQKYTGNPAKVVLPSLTELVRIHSIRFESTAFNPTLADPHWGGGRFDATIQDEYGYLYAASTDAAAVSETLLRDLPIDDAQNRLLTRAAIRERRFAWLRTLSDLDLVSLRSGEDLGVLMQDTWLVTAPSREYGATRRWAHAVRSWAPWAQGFVWHSLREPEALAYVFFQDRCPDNCFEEFTTGTPIPPRGSRRLDQGMGHQHLKAILARYRVAIGAKKRS
jgi:hypothetical protein